MPNTYVNKVVKSDGATLIDLTSDTVTSASHIVAGYVGHLADGSQVTGTAPKKHTATVTARTNSSGYVRYIGSTGTQYGTIGDTFEFNQGEELYAVGMDSRGAAGKIIIDGVTVANGGQDSVSYTYTLPDHDISISFSAGTTSIEEASSVSLQSKSVSYTPSETAQTATVTADSGYDGLSSVEVSVGAISSSYVGSGIDRRSSSDLAASGATVTVPSGYYASQATKSVASGTEGTPTATKGSVSNHSVSVTPSVTNAAGYISGGTKTGTAVTVSASELVSGSETVTENGTVDVTNLASVVVNVPSGGTAAISVVDTTDSHGGTVRTITALDISDTTAVASDVAQGKYFYTAQGVKTAGSASGGTPSQTQHNIYFEFSDSTDTTITGYWNDSFISDAITATTPTTYGQKTVTLAQLDGVTWYEPSAETWETLYDDRKAANSDTPYNYLWFDSLSDVYPTVDSVWRVTIDGTSYRCTAYAMTVASAGNVVCFGNPKYSGGTDDGSGIPFNAYNAGWGALVADTELSAVEHAIKIERLVTS